MNCIWIARILCKLSVSNLRIEKSSSIDCEVCVVASQTLTYTIKYVGKKMAWKSEGLQINLTDDEEQGFKAYLTNVSKLDFSPFEFDPMFDENCSFSHCAYVLIQPSYLLFQTIRKQFILYTVYNKSKSLDENVAHY